LRPARRLGWQFDIMSTSFFLSRRALRLAVRSGMPRWQDRLFIGLRVVEVGTQVTV
jgi:KUP system potassium uptake protein